MPKRILLADDSITIQKVVELTFSDGDYEVVAVNNGAKAIAKLSEMRPDIILSDIIMPEKNGYEVCEFVKSHPEYRTIPVVLLTGTFEPFDPDRADKAGCDAVVTKPFESQSLIHKVDELIAQAQTAAPAAAAPEPEPAPSPWADETPAPAFGGAPATTADESPFGGGAPAFNPAPGADAFASGFNAHGGDIFGAAPSAPAAPANDMPFETAGSEAFSSETRAFTRMSFDELSKMAETPQPAAAPPPPRAPEPEPPATSPWDEQAPAFGGETRAFPRMSFDDLQQTQAPAPTPAPEPEPPAIEPSPWDEQAAPAFGGETRAFPRMSFDDLASTAEQQPAFSAPEPEPAAPAAPEVSPWDEQPAAFGGETRAFPRMSFDDLQQMQPASSPAPAPEPEPEPVRADSPLFEEPAAPPSWPSEEPAQPEEHSSPFAHAEELPFATAPAAEPEPAWSPAPVEPEVTTHAPAAAAEAAPSAAVSGDLTDEQIERIARRVVQMLSADVLKNIAWEVIPDMAEMVVKERIRQLESEA
jgi:CheY-like chemotaxis protein